MKRHSFFRPPVLTDREAETIGREASLNRWRAQMLRQAILAVGAVLDSTAGLPERARDDLHDALTSCVLWHLEFTMKGGAR